MPRRDRGLEVRRAAAPPCRSARRWSPISRPSPATGSPCSPWKAVSPCSNQHSEPALSPHMTTPRAHARAARRRARARATRRASSARSRRRRRSGPARAGASRGLRRAAVAAEQRHVRRLAARGREVPVEADDVVVRVTRRGREEAHLRALDRPWRPARSRRAARCRTPWRTRRHRTPRPEGRATWLAVCGPKRSYRADFLLWSNALWTACRVKRGAGSADGRQRGHPPLRGHLRALVRPRHHRGPADGPRRALVRDRHADRRGDRARRRRRARRCSTRCCSRTPAARATRPGCRRCSAPTTSSSSAPAS